MMAYLGSELALKSLLLDPPHSLYVQSWQPRELREARLNADGYGYGWYADDGEPATYTSAAPIWHDHNLPHLARSLRRPLWLAYVRSATTDLAVNIQNTQPLCHGRWLFVHNGLVRNFAVGLRGRLRAWLEPEIEALIRGNSDSEYLFAAFLQMRMQMADHDTEAVLAVFCERIGNWLGADAALLNFVLSDGERVYAMRHAVQGECPSLYLTVDDPTFPDAQLIASEPLTERSRWESIPEHHLVVLTHNAPPRQIAL